MRMPIPAGLLFSCRGTGFSKPSDRPRLGLQPALWAGINSIPDREAAVGELGACLLSSMAKNNLITGSLPPQNLFLGFSSGRKSALVVPFA